MVSSERLDQQSEVDIGNIMVTPDISGAKLGALVTTKFSYICNLLYLSDIPPPGLLEK